MDVSLGLNIRQVVLSVCFPESTVRKACAGVRQLRAEDFGCCRFILDATSNLSAT